MRGAFIVSAATALGLGCSSSPDGGQPSGAGDPGGDGAPEGGGVAQGVHPGDGGSVPGDSGSDVTSGGGNACAAIADFRSTSTTPTAVTLAWTGGAGTSVTLSRKTYCSDDAYMTVATLPAGTTTYTDTTVSANYVYWYEIEGMDGSSTAAEALATQASATPMPACSGGAPPAPSGVTSSCSSPPDGGLEGGTGEGGTVDSGPAPPIVDAFYVATTGADTNLGTEASPFATLAKAQSAMQASSSIKTTYIRAGKYTLPKLDCGGSSCGLDLVSADEGETWSYYPPDGVDSADLSGGSTSAGNGLVSAISVQANNVTIDGLSIHDFSYAGIGSGGGVDNLLVENNVIFNGYSASGDSNPAGISCYGCGNMTIAHNVIHDIAQFGVSVSNVNGDISNLLVTGNVVYNTCTAIADCGALYVQDIHTTATNMRLTNNYVHDGNTFAGLGSNSGSALYLDDCTSNVTESGNVITGRNGSNTMHVHGGSNIQQTGNLTDLGTYAQHAAIYQTSAVSACASATMSGNVYEHNIVIGAGGGGGFQLLSGSPKNAPTISNNDYYSYGSAAISSGGTYSDTAPANVNPQLSGWTYAIAAGSAVLQAPVSFPALIGGWGPPGYVIPQTGSPPSSPH